MGIVEMLKRRGYPLEPMAVAVSVVGLCGALAFAAYDDLSSMPTAICHWSLGVLSVMGAVIVAMAISPRGAQIRRILRAEIYLIYLFAVSTGFALGAATRFDGDAIIFALVAALAWSVGSNLYSRRDRLSSDAEDQS